jgi:preprotein translocase subunit SecB
MAEEQPAAPGEENKAALRPEKIYLKDVSFETPNSPTIFTLEWQPQLNFDIGQKVARVSDEGLYEVVLVLTATTTVGDQTAYLAEVHQAGIFTIQGADQAQLDRLLAVFCPRMLYPYACATMSDLVSKGGFPQLLLAPLDFQSMYQQRLDVAQKNSAAQEVESS